MSTEVRGSSKLCTPAFRSFGQDSLNLFTALQRGKLAYNVVCSKRIVPEVLSIKKLAFSLVALLVTLIAFAQSARPNAEETIAALEEGITNLPLEAALTTIGGWRETLEASDDTALRIIGVQLGDLTTALQSEPINPGEVGSLLTALGKATVIVGEDADNDQALAIGDLLTQAGTMLSVEAAEVGTNSGGSE